MLEYESIPGVSSSKPFGGRTKAHADITVKSITKKASGYFCILTKWLVWSRMGPSQLTVPWYKIHLARDEVALFRIDLSHPAAMLSLLHGKPRTEFACGRGLVGKNKAFDSPETQHGRRVRKAYVPVRNFL